MFEISNLISRCGPRVIPGAAFVLALTLETSWMQAAYGQTTQPDAPSATGSTDVVNQITQFAVQIGALSCAAKIQQVTSFLGVTSETKASLRRPQNPPDKNSLSIAMTIATDGTTGIALAEFFPTDSGCKASYSLTVNLPQSCDALRTSGFALLTDENKLFDNINLLAGPNTLRVLLIGSNEECTVIKTETLD
ncbi:MAG: hypothetical protein IKE14_13720 [Loktanella sp.]|nr:hypothetical protein [Loktanella sp.]